VIKYTDLEGDKIVVSTQIEWEEMLQELSEEKIIKIIVEEGSQRYFKDGPNPEPQYFYSDVISKIPEEMNNILEKFQSAVPKCLETLFRDGKIIPSNIPTFLQEAVKPKYVNEDVVDLDIDIYKLFDLLHRKSLECLESVDKNLIQKGKEYILSMLQLVPNHTIALYNLACAESLLENVPEAIRALESAIENGYSNLTHMLNDKDLDNIKNTEAFVNLVKKLENLISKVGEHIKVDVPEEKVEEKIEEKIEENIEENFDDDLEMIEPVVIEDNNNNNVIDTSIFMDKILIHEKNCALTDSFFDLRMKWIDQINELKNMGFLCDDEVLSLILEQCEGKLEDAVLILLSQKSS
jgi:tetratricopeptide (TPR) repeat protein